MPDKTHAHKKTEEYQGRRAFIYGGVVKDQLTMEYPSELVHECSGAGCKKLVIGTPQSIRVGGGRYWTGGTIGDPDNKKTVVLCNGCAGKRR